MAKQPDITPKCEIEKPYYKNYIPFYKKAFLYIVT